MLTEVVLYVWVCGGQVIDVLPPQSSDFDDVYMVRRRQPDTDRHTDTQADTQTVVPWRLGVSCRLLTWRCCCW